MKWNEVTWYSRLGAIILFVGVVPVLTFYIGMQYEKVLSLRFVDVVEEIKVFIPEQSEEVKTQVDEIKMESTESVQVEEVVNTKYSKEDAIRVSADNKLWVQTNFGVGSPRYRADAMKLVPAQFTGEGMAWFVESDDYHYSNAECTNPPFNSADSWVTIRFEMNAETGVVDIQKNCRYGIFD